MSSKKPNSQKLFYSEEVDNNDYESEFDEEFYAQNEEENEEQSFEVEKPKSKKSNKEKQSNKQKIMQNSNNYDSDEIEEKEKKKQRNWVINTGNMAIIASSLSIAVDVIHKLLRMTLYAYGGLIIFLYVISGILSVFALIACIKNAFKYKQISIDAYFTGISFIMLILV